MLISSILNFQTAGFDSATGTFRRGNDLPYVVFLPSYAATAWHHGKLGTKDQERPLREFLDEVEQKVFAIKEGNEVQGEIRARDVIGEDL